MGDREQRYNLPKIVYPSRCLGYGLSSAPIAVLLYEHHAGLLSWILLAVTCFLWPQAAYLFSSRAVKPIKAELGNVVFDSVLGGVWSGLLSYHPLVSAVMFAMLMMDNISVGGARFLARGCVAFALGAVAGGSVTGFHLQFETSLLAALACIPVIILFPAANGLTAYARTMRVIKLKNTIEMQNDELYCIKQILLERNEKMEHDIDLARKIQDQLIPKQSPAKNISYLYKPMEEVGGDFYDFIAFRNPDRIGIFISDVSGHGIPAAFITSMIKTTIAQAGRRRENPAALLNYIDDVLHKQTGENFITAFYGIYDSRDRSLLYSNAGHPQPYVITNEGVSQLQAGMNTALAMFPVRLTATTDIRYQNFREILPASAKLLFFTDGLIEARKREEDLFFENDRMRQVFLENRDADAETFIQKIYESMTAFRGSESFEDDVCLVCLEVIEPVRRKLPEMNTL